MKLKHTFLFFGLLGFFACGEDDQTYAKPVYAKSAEWSFLANGEMVSGDKLKITETEAWGYVMKIYNDNEESMEFSFGSKPPRAKFYEEGWEMEFYAYYYSPLDTINMRSGEMDIVKYDADSLVATFAFQTTGTDETPAMPLTEGIIKARLR